MLDPRTIRANPERLKQIVRLRKVDPAKADVDRWLELDDRRRALQTEIDAVNVEKKQIAALGKTDPNAARQKGQELRERSRELDEAFAASEGALEAARLAGGDAVLAAGPPPPRSAALA